MKKILSVVALLVLVSMLSASAFAEYVKTADSDGTLNVRSGPGTSYSILGYVKNGTKIKVLNKGTNWSNIKVVSNGRVGYIKNKYISAKMPETEPANKKVVSVKTKYAGSCVNLRKNASASSAILTELPNGARLLVLGSSGNWYRVKTVSGAVGYIAKTYTKAGAAAVINANGVHLRKGAGTGYASLGKMKSGTAILVGVRGSSWSKIKVNGKIGYVKNTYYKFK